MNMNKKARLMGALLGASMLGMDLQPIERQPRKTVKDGHTVCNTQKDANVKKWRAKERRAKKARKLNWN